MLVTVGLKDSFNVSPDLKISPQEYLHGVRRASRDDVEKYAGFATNRSDHFGRSYAQDSPMVVQFGMAGF